MALYNVSRMTARRALDDLVARGILLRRQGKGTFVADAVMSYDLSTILSFSRTLRARGLTVVTKVLCQESIPGPHWVLQQLELPPNSEVVLVRRLRIVEGKPAAIHTSYMDYRLYAPILLVDLSTASLLEEIERISGTRVSHSRDSVQARLADPEESELLSISPYSPVLCVEGVAYLAGGQPVRYTNAIYRADLFKLVVTNTADQAILLKLTIFNNS